MVEDVDVHKTESDYVVGWIDTTARGRSLGRGQIHTADYLRPDEDPHPIQTLSLEYQNLPDTLFGLVPKSIIWRFMKPFMSNLGTQAINTGKYWSSRTIGHQKRFKQSFAAFNFLLDYIPNWERSYGKGGLIQYQSFVPKDHALDVFSELLALSQKRHLPSYLGVFKRHRPDEFLLSHAVDGYSLALDFRVTRKNRAALSQLTSGFSKLVLESGGRFYFAKDSVLSPVMVEGFLGSDTIRRFKALKGNCDPQNLLQSDLYRRCFPSE
jgi:hypothetical protein